MSTTVLARTQLKCSPVHICSHIDGRHVVFLSVFNKSGVA